MSRVGVVFVHGILSSAAAWSAFQRLMDDDPSLTAFDSWPFEYSSPVMEWRPDRAIPDLDVIAGGLDTFLTHRLAGYQRAVLAGHSQGGLVIQRYLHRMLSEGRGEELARIRLVILFACPNDGSQFLATLGAVAGLVFRHPQERALRPLNAGINEARRTVMNRVVAATQVAADTCPIPLFAYAGASDGVVKPSSAHSVFPRVGVLPGDHSSIIRPESDRDLAYIAFRNHLLNDLIARAGDDRQVIADARLRAYGQVNRTVHHVVRPAQSEQIRAALTGGGVTVLHGPGGIGKSVLAYDACEDPVVAERFPDVLWATLGQDARVGVELARWLRALGGGTDTIVPDLDFLRMEVAARLQDRRCLLVVDDAWRVSDVQAFNIGGPNCHLLITTRIARIAHELGVEPLAIPFLDDWEALVLLRRWARGHLNETADGRLTPIIGRVSCLPLAVKLAGARLADVSVDDWLARFDVRRLRAAQVEGVHDSLVATIDLSLDMLEPGARAACEALAVFPEDLPVTADIIDQCWRALELPGATDDLLADLYHQALTQQAADPNGVVRHALHDLVRDVLIFHLGSDGWRRVHRGLLDSYQVGDSGWPEAADDGYIYDNLAYHLEEADDHQAAVRLFTDQRWMNARLDHDPRGYDGYLSDLALVREASEKIGDHGPDLAEMHRYAVIESSLQTLSGAYSPVTIARALILGVWTPEFAMSVARRGGTEPIATLLLTRRLPPVHAVEAERLLLESIDPTSGRLPRADAIGTYLAALLGSASLRLAGAIAEWLHRTAVADHVPDGIRTGAIITLARHRPWHECGAELMAAARMLPGPARSWAKRALAEMEGAPDVFAEAEDEDEDENSPDDVPASITHLIAALSTRSDRDRSDLDREFTLGSLENSPEHLSEDDAGQMLEAVLRGEEIWKPIRVLRAISGRLSSRQRETAALWLMRQEPSPDRLLALAHMQPAGEVKVLLSIDGTLAESLVAAIRGPSVPNDSDSGQSDLSRLVYKLLDSLYLLFGCLDDEAEKAAAIEEAKRVLLTQEEPPINPYGHGGTLSNPEPADRWIPFLSGPELRAFLRKPRHIGETFWSQDAQATLAQSASPSVRSAVASHLARSAPESTAMHLAPLVFPWLGSDERTALINRCLDRWSTTTTHEPNSSSQPRSEAIENLAGLLTAGQMTRVIDELERIPDGVNTLGQHQPRVAAIISLGKHPPTTENSLRLAETARNLSSAEDRRTALAALAPSLPPDIVDTLWAYADEPSAKSSAILLAALLGRLPIKERGAHNAAVREHADAITSRGHPHPDAFPEFLYDNAEWLEALITSSAPTVLPYLVAVGRRFPKQSYEIVRCLAAAATRFSKSEGDLLIREAYDIADPPSARQQPPGGGFGLAMRHLAPLLPPDLAQLAWKRLLTVNTHDEDDNYRLQRLLQLLRHHPQLDPSLYEARKQVSRHLRLLGRNTLSSVLYFDGVANWLGPDLITSSIADEMIQDITKIDNWSLR